MITPDQNENSFEPHSDAELASILEQQLAQMRGNLGVGEVPLPIAMPMMFSASEMHNLMAAPSQQVEGTSEVEQQLINVLAEIEAIEAAKALRRAAAAVDVTEKTSPVEVAPIRGGERSNIVEKPPVVDRLSFDDLLFGTAADE